MSPTSPAYSCSPTERGIGLSRNVVVHCFICLPHGARGTTETEWWASMLQRRRTNANARKQRERSSDAWTLRQLHHRRHARRGCAHTAARRGQCGARGSHTARSTDLSVHPHRAQQCRRTIARSASASVACLLSATIRTLPEADDDDDSDDAAAAPVPSLAPFATCARLPRAAALLQGQTTLCRPSGRRLGSAA